MRKNCLKHQLAQCSTWVWTTMFIFPGPPDIHLMPLHVMILLSLHSLLYLLVTKHWTYKVPSSRVVHPPQNMACKYFNSSNDSRSFSTRSQAHSKYRSPWKWGYLKVFLFSPFAGRTEERSYLERPILLYVWHTHLMIRQSMCSVSDRPDSVMYEKSGNLRWEQKDTAYLMPQRQITHRNICLVSKWRRNVVDNY